MQAISKTILILTTVFLLGVTVVLPLLHHHPDSVEEPSDCLANALETNLHSCQNAQLVFLKIPHNQPSDEFVSLESPEFLTFGGYLFVNKAPPTL